MGRHFIENIVGKFFGLGVHEWISILSFKTQLFLPSLYKCDWTTFEGIAVSE